MVPNSENIMESIQKGYEREDVFITKEMVEKAYNAGKIKIRKTPVSFGDIVCIMPNPRSVYDWFYFEPRNATISEKLYKKKFTPREIVNRIFHALEGMRENPDVFDVEYEDYYWRLKEALGI